MPNPIDVPDGIDSLRNIGEVIMNYQPYQNAFLNAIVNRIGRTIITSKMWNNPWSVFKKGYLEFGETVEEIFVNIAQPFTYDPQGAESTWMRRNIPDVRAAFHKMNFQKYYKATISNDQLRQAFLSWQGITDLIAKIVDSMYTGMRYDEYITMKYMVCREIVNGDMAVVESAAAGVSNYKSIIAGIRATSSKLEFLSTAYNRAGVSNATMRDDQYVIISADMEANVDVEVLAAAFNMGKAEFLGHVIIVDSFTQHDTARLAMLFENNSFTPFTEAELTSLGKVNALILDEDWWMVFDNFENFTQNYNGEGLYWQYWYHTWKTFSVSPFANAVVFSSESSSITSVTVSPDTASVQQGQIAQFSASVVKVGTVKTTVKWSITSESTLKAGTKIDQNGLLHVDAAEPANTEITVKATSTVDSTKYDTAVATVVAAS